ncbi:hypothetical protein VTP01DRAFT_1259 [Rhizomucor pusillus]|uniref:uncharacterized protein n=1 Tax=Rhizomucor pusillus TaxID=4840 RepID=UPI003742F457
MNSPRIASVGQSTISSKRLHIGNLAETIDEYRLVSLCRKYGKITCFDYLFHTKGPKKGKPRDYCFVEFDTQENALTAMKDLHGRVLDGRPLYVSFASVTPQTPEQTDARKNDSLRKIDPLLIKKGYRSSKTRTEMKIKALERKLEAMKNNKPY